MKLLPTHLLTQCHKISGFFFDGFPKWKTVNGKVVRHLICSLKVYVCQFVAELGCDVHSQLSMVKSSTLILLISMKKSLPLSILGGMTISGAELEKYKLVEVHLNLSQNFFNEYIM